jgi:hypothetical protein
LVSGVRKNLMNRPNFSPLKGLPSWILRNLAQASEETDRGDSNAALTLIIAANSES